VTNSNLGCIRNINLFNSLFKWAN